MSFQNMLCRRLRRCFPALAVLCFCNCTSSADTTADTIGTTVVRDSVANDDSVMVRVIESTAQPTDERLAPFTVDPEPMVTIGRSDGDEPYLLHRVYDALRLYDGRIVAGNSGSQELRVFSADGRYERSVGRRGAGPGEFSDYGSIQLHRWADSLLATDDGRVHVYTEALDSARTRPYDLTSGAARPFTRGVFGNGTWLALAADGGGTLNGAPGEVINMRFQLLHYTANGSFTRSLLAFQGRPRYVLETETSRTFPYVPLTADLLEGIVGDSLVVLRDGLPELQWYDQQGRLVQVARWSRTRVRTRDVYPEFVDSSMAGLRRGTDRDDEARYATLFTRDLPLAEFAPQYTALKVDAVRRIWLERSIRLAWNGCSNTRFGGGS